MVKKNGLVKLTRPEINVTLILSTNPIQVPQPYTINYSKNAGMVATKSETSKNRKIGCYYTFTNTTK
jgi:hypothetical protein